MDITKIMKLGGQFSNPALSTEVTKDGNLRIKSRTVAPIAMVIIMTMKLKSDLSH